METEKGVAEANMRGNMVNFSHEALARQLQEKAELVCIGMAPGDQSYRPNYLPPEEDCCTRGDNETSDNTSTESIQQVAKTGYRPGLGRHQLNINNGEQEKNSMECPMEGCTKTFTWPAHRKYHLLTHSNNRAYQCSLDTCARSFYTLQRLKVHMQVHTGERPFSCTHKGCGKQFSTQGNLQNHLRTHSGEKPFACSQEGCSMSFAERSSLRKHMLVHTGEKPYVCDLCGKHFSQSGSRNQHMKRCVGHVSPRFAAAKTGANKRRQADDGSATMVPTFFALPLADSTRILIVQQAENDVFHVQDLTTGTRESVILTGNTEPVSSPVSEPLVHTPPHPCPHHILGAEEVLLPAAESIVDDVTDTQLALSQQSYSNVVVVTEPHLVAMDAEYGHQPTSDMEYQQHEILDTGREEILIAQDVPIMQTDDSESIADATIPKDHGIAEHDGMPTSHVMVADDNVCTSDDGFLNYEPLMATTNTNL
ncbi:PREDICTED: zinc finger protein 143-like isoform X1 [Priapulus caudatus]|uniref:Zinc finger protein 143-like isoform X1 n=1 Tax=Priapulus caudatus TaxID=37621 RepID=A0ABM1ESS7_PRICU|nr:PREDICTED: zinc finger protein 143-like isoform X1 [Priapulus caudatus]